MMCNNISKQNFAWVWNSLIRYHAWSRYWPYWYLKWPAGFLGAPAGSLARLGDTIMATAGTPFRPVPANFDHCVRYSTDRYMIPFRLGTAEPLRYNDLFGTCQRPLQYTTPSVQGPVQCLHATLDTMPNSMSTKINRFFGRTGFVQMRTTAKEEDLGYMEMSASYSTFYTEYYRDVPVIVIRRSMLSSLIYKPIRSFQHFFEDLYFGLHWSKMKWLSVLVTLACRSWWPKFLSGSVVKLFATPTHVHSCVRGPGSIVGAESLDWGFHPSLRTLADPGVQVGGGIWHRETASMYGGVEAPLVRVLQHSIISYTHCSLAQWVWKRDQLNGDKHSPS